MKKYQNSKKSISELVSNSMMRFIITVLVVVAVISCFIEYVAVLKTCKESLKLGSMIAADRIEWAIQSYKNIVEDMGTMPSLSRDDFTVEQKKQILQNKCDEYNLIRSLIINPDGYSDMDDNYRGDRVYFDHAMNGETIFGNPVLSKVDGELILVAAAPLWHDGVYDSSIDGVVFISINPELLNQILEAMEITESSEVYVIADNGTIVASTNFDEVTGSVNHIDMAATDSSYRHIASMEQKALSGEDGVFITRKGLRRQLYALQTISGTPGWHLVMRVPLYDVMSGFRLSVIVMLLAIPLIWFIIRFRSVKVAQQIGNPFREIAERLQRAAEGDFSSEVLEFGDTAETRIISNAARNLVGRLEYMVTDDDEYKTSATLEDLIDVQTLKNFQEMVTVSTGLRTTIMNSDGLRVTSPIGDTIFCDKLTRGSELGYSRCDRCERDGTHMAIDRGCCVSYYCHTGLKIYAVPIMLDGHSLGAVLCGRVRTEAELDKEKLLTIADELGIDKNEYIKAASDIKLWDTKAQNDIEEVLNSVGRLMSTMCHNEYLQRMKARKQVKKAKMTAAPGRTTLQESTATGKIASLMAEFTNDPGQMDAISPDATSTFRDIDTDIREDESGILESIYNLRELVKAATANMDFRLKGKDVDFVLDVERTLPRRLLGDDKKVTRIIAGILKCASAFTDAGYINMKVSAVRNVYAFYLKIRVEYSGGGADEISPEIMRSFFETKNYYSTANRSANELDLIMLSTIIRQMNGSVEIKENDSDGVSFCVILPQLEFSE